MTTCYYLTRDGLFVEALAPIGDGTLPIIRRAIKRHSFAITGNYDADYRTYKYYGLVLNDKRVYEEVI